MKNESSLFDYLDKTLDDPQLEESFKKQERIKEKFESDEINLTDYSAAFLVVKPVDPSSGQHAIQIKSEFSQEETIKMLEGFLAAVKNSARQ